MQKFRVINKKNQYKFISESFTIKPLTESEDRFLQTHKDYIQYYNETKNAHHYILNDYNILFTDDGHIMLTKNDITLYIGYEYSELVRALKW